MKTRFIVIHAKGPSWDPTKLRRDQAEWHEHAEFMDKLTAEGFVELGGPLGEGDGEDAMLVIDAPDEETVVSRLKEDPWKQSGMLVVKSIQRWNIFLESEKK
jgi:uncharacterized protein YciI